MDAARTFGNPDIVIAVVDSGIDDTHPELSGTVSNGNAKQVALFDFANMAANMNSLGGDHGTACASAAAANINNASVVAGINEGIAGVAGQLPADWHSARRHRSALRRDCTSGLRVSTLAARPRAFRPSWRGGRRHHQQLRLQHR